MMEPLRQGKFPTTLPLVRTYRPIPCMHVSMPMPAHARAPRSSHYLNCWTHRTALLGTALAPATLHMFKTYQGSDSQIAGGSSPNIPLSSPFKLLTVSSQ
jgi:hypothetical protein